MAAILLATSILVTTRPANAAGTTADQVYGQSGSFTTHVSTAGTTGLKQPGAIAVDSVHHRLFVADFTNNRVVVFNLDSTNKFTDATADYVIGQPDFTTTTTGITQSTMNGPFGATYDSVNDRLFVADAGNNRILVFNTSAITNGMNAAYVLGQSTFTTNAFALTQAGLHTPHGLDFDPVNNRLFVADYYNNRAVVFPTASITNGENASYVLGEPNFTTANAVVSQSGLNNEQGLSYDSSANYLYVADGSANRVIVYNLASIANGMNATYVLGQSNFTGYTGSLSQAGLGNPIGVDAHSGIIFVAEQNNDRIVGYNKAALANGMNASLVYGQPDFNTATSSTTATGTSYAWNVTYDSSTGTLYIADSGNNRVLQFNGAPIGGNAIVQVDPTFSLTTANQSTACNG